MKKLLILIVFGAVYLHYYPQPELTQWYESTKNDVIGQVKDATGTQLRLNITRVSEDLEEDIQRFSEDEQEYITDIISSRNSIKNFYTEHCQDEVRNEAMSKANQAVVCRVFSRYTSLM